MSTFDRRHFNARVYDIILQRIIRGDYRAGEKISVQQLADELRISRSPVKDALTKLHGAGIIDITPQRGHYVHVVSSQELEDLFEFRLLIEAYAGKKAARVARHRDFQRLDKILAAAAPLVSRSTARDIIRFSALDSSFHLEIVRMVANVTLIKVYTDAHFHLHNFGTQFASIRKRAGQAHEEHCEIVWALKSGDAKRIEASITHHLEMVRRNLTASMAEKSE